MVHLWHTSGGVESREAVGWRGSILNSGSGLV